MSGRKFLKSTQILKNPNWTVESRKKIDANWRKQSEPTMPEVKREIKKALRVNSELKFFDTVIASASQSTTAIITSLCEVPQGDTDQTRDADKLKTVNLESRFTIIGGDLTNVFRVVIVFMKDNAVPVVTDILQTNVYDAPIDHDATQGKMFTVLYDKFIPITTVAQSNSTAWVHKIKLGRSIQYLTGTTGSLSGKIFLMTMCDSAALPHPLMKSSHRLRFTDI